MWAEMWRKERKINCVKGVKERQVYGGKERQKNERK